MSNSPSDPLNLLRFYVDAGVDIALADAPVDRFALSAAQAEAAEQRRKEQAAAAQSTPSPAPLQPSPSAPSRATAAPPPPLLTPEPPRPAQNKNFAVPSEAAALAARDAVASIETLDALREALAAFEGCNLRNTATNLVFADGNPEARVMFVGEAPGLEEDLQGLPFVGRSGKLLDRMLAAIGLDRTSAYIANVIPWRPPGNRTPTPQETEICRPFIARQIELADPDFLVALGGAAAKQLFQTSEGILRLRGRWRTYDTGRRTIRAMATLHPAYLLRQPLQKRLAWRDFLSLKEALQEPR